MVFAGNEISATATAGTETVSGSLVCAFAKCQSGVCLAQLNLADGISERRMCQSVSVSKAAATKQSTPDVRNSQFKDKQRGRPQTKCPAGKDPSSTQLPSLLVGSNLTACGAIGNKQARHHFAVLDSGSVDHNLVIRCWTKLLKRPGFVLSAHQAYLDQKIDKQTSPKEGCTCKFFCDQNSSVFGYGIIPIYLQCKQAVPNCGF